MAVLTSRWMERIFFILVVVGVLAALYGTVRVIDIAIKLNNNIAHQQHNSDEPLDVQSTAEGRGMMVADLERRELLKLRGQMLIWIGTGIALLGLGWLGYDLRSGRLRKEQEGELVEVADSA